ncbi:anti-sigma factor [Thioclava sp. JE_KL1]|uniref:anti-sigma factor family protein n=1 Tax=Thioclava sp. JE_KL1 TaxID=2651187 RepID=UPI00128D5FC2|nr:anti-sigma factor [Thioclava sp. JE_KL1]MPQ93271.1 anti-sigma factor [Thioclava sp. JE_KL1]
MTDPHAEANMLNEAELHGYLDDRLPPEARDRVQAKLAADPALAQRLSAMRADRDALRAALSPIHAAPVPARLRLATPTRPDWTRMAAALALFAAGLGAGWGLARQDGSAPPAAPLRELAREAQVAHAVYTVEVVHPVEVAARERDHLMAWLTKRLDRKLVAPDLSAQGYSLVGGRLLPADQGPAAQLMYETRAGARLTLYVTALSTGETAFRLTEGADGVASLIWVDRGYGFALSAPLSGTALWPMAEAAYRQLAFRQ